VLPFPRQVFTIDPCPIIVVFVICTPGTSWDALTPLPLAGGGHGGFSHGGLLGGVSHGKGSLGVNHFLGVCNLHSREDRGGGLDSLEDGGGQTGDRADGEVGALDAETIDVVSDVVDSLKETVSIDVLVGASGDSVGVTGLSLGGRTSGVSERELSELILGMELVGGGGCGNY
jgi:hypothetical protein